MVLHVKIPEVMRITVKCAKNYLRKVDLKTIQLLKVSSNAVKTDQLGEEEKDDQANDFLSQAIKKIGAKISHSEPEDSSSQTQAPIAEDNKPDDAAEQKEEKEYFVYTNLN